MITEKEKREYLDEKICGTCRRNRYDGDEDDYYCGNIGGRNHGISTQRDGTCKDWESRE